MRCASISRASTRSAPSAGRAARKVDLDEARAFATSAPELQRGKRNAEVRRRLCAGQREVVRGLRERRDAERGEALTESRSRTIRAARRGLALDGGRRRARDTRRTGGAGGSSRMSRHSGNLPRPVAGVWLRCRLSRDGSRAWRRGAALRFAIAARLQRFRIRPSGSPVF